VLDPRPVAGRLPAVGRRRRLARLVPVRPAVWGQQAEAEVRQRRPSRQEQAEAEVRRRRLARLVPVRPAVWGQQAEAEVRQRRPSRQEQAGPAAEAAPAVRGQRAEAAGERRTRPARLVVAAVVRPVRGRRRRRCAASRPRGHGRIPARRRGPGWPAPARRRRSAVRDWPGSQKRRIRRRRVRPRCPARIAARRGTRCRC
jgi:hypothetical protein